jgi:hypothetical protein
MLTPYWWRKMLKGWKAALQQQELDVKSLVAEQHE